MDLLKHGWHYFWLLLALLSLLALKTEAGEPVKVAIVDTGLDLQDVRLQGYLCPEGHHDFTGEGLVDRIGHGTHIAGLIVQYAESSPGEDYCLMILKYYRAEDTNRQHLRHSSEAFQWSADHGARLVNFSSYGTDSDAADRKVLASASKTLFIVAAGNDGEDLDLVPAYPASYGLPNIIAVGNVFKMLGVWHKKESSNYGSLVKAWEPGTNMKSFTPNGGETYYTGSSMSAAVHTGKLVKAIVAFRNGFCSPFESCLPVSIHPGDAAP